MSKMKALLQGTVSQIIAENRLTASLRNMTSKDASSQPTLLQANAFILAIIHLSFSNNIDPSEEEDEGV